jgi:hypothetical protein
MSKLKYKSLVVITKNKTNVTSHHNVLIFNLFVTTFFLLVRVIVLKILTLH